MTTREPTRSADATAPRTDLSFLERTIRSVDADAFVHVGDRFDDSMRYLTRFAGPDRPYAFVFVPGANEDSGRSAEATADRSVKTTADRSGEDANADRSRAVLCAPGLFVAQATREFVDHHGEIDGVSRSVRSTSIGDPPGDRAARTLDRSLKPSADSTVLVPAHLPHEAAVRLESAGYELRSTDAVAAVRRQKSPAEIDRLRAVQSAAVRGMRRAESILAVSEPASETGALTYNGSPLTTERLRRAIDAELAESGVRAAGNTVIGAGQSAADLHFTGEEPIAPGETVLIDISPRGPAGYYGDLTRTFVKAGDGGWERRAYVAVEAAREAALAHLKAGVPASQIHTEAAAELGAYGFRIDAGEGESGFTHGTGHGVGLSLHEGPSLRSDHTLEAGHVVTIEPGVYDPDRGGVRLEDLVVVTEQGYELLAPYPFSIVPETRTDR